MSRSAFERSLRRFRVGQRVTLSRRGVQAGLQGRARTAEGVVTSLRAGWLNVRRTGIKRAEAYHPDLWEPWEEGKTWWSG